MERDVAGRWLISLALRDVLGWSGSPLGCLFVPWLWNKLRPGLWVTKEFLLLGLSLAVVTGTVLQSLALKREV